MKNTVFDGFLWINLGPRWAPPLLPALRGPGQLPFGCARVLHVGMVRRGGVDLRERYGNQRFDGFWHFIAAATRCGSGQQVCAETGRDLLLCLRGRPLRTNITRCPPRGRRCAVAYTEAGKF
jgi:hypothetical protein